MWPKYTGHVTYPYPNMCYSIYRSHIQNLDGFHQTVFKILNLKVCKCFTIFSSKTSVSRPALIRTKGWFPIRLSSHVITLKVCDWSIFNQNTQEWRFTTILLKKLGILCNFWWEMSPNDTIFYIFWHILRIYVGHVTKICKSRDLPSPQNVLQYI